MMSMKPKIRKRYKLQESAGAFHITVPALWVKSLGLERGDELWIEFNASSLNIYPVNQSTSEVARVEETTSANTI